MSVIGVYCRVSGIKLKSDGERRQDVERQLSLLVPFADEYANKVGAIDVKTFVDDGVSAAALSNKKRPAFLDLVNAVKAGTITAVFVEDYTRFARDAIEGFLMWKLLESKGVFFFSHKDGGEIDLKDPSDKLTFRLKLVIEENKEDIRRAKVLESVQTRKKKAEDFSNKGIGDGKELCESCHSLHLGRHPNSCKCKTCEETRRKKALKVSSL